MLDLELTKNEIDDCCTKIKGPVLIYFGSMVMDADVIRMLKNNYDLLAISISEQCELIRYLNTTLDTVACLSLDIEYCQNLANTNAHDYIRMLSTILSIRGINAPIIGITQLNTDAKWIKEFITIPEVKGIAIRASESNPEEMQQALNDMVRGKHHIPLRIRKKIQDLKKKKKSNASANVIVLTPRQNQILDLVVSKGASNKVIANILKISESTVKLHITNILKKYGLRNRTQLALFAKTND